jgi:predicted nucleotidyltransferase
VKLDSLTSLTRNDRVAIARYIELIRDRFTDRILSVTLFGSKARGDADDESDIDVLVIVDADDEALRPELWRIASDVSLDYYVVISPRVFSKARWAETRRIWMPLYRAVQADGVPLTSDRIPA